MASLDQRRSFTSALTGGFQGSMRPRTTVSLESASQDDIRDALSQLRSFRPARPEDTTRAADTYSAATVGDSEGMSLLRSQIKRIAPYFRTALVTGNPGTGKEGVARMLHALSPCADGEFLAQPASTFAEAIARDQLGAAFDAVVGSPVGGTLYLSEVGEVPLALQSALLRVWSLNTRGRMRVVAGTHRDLRTMGVTGHLRTDLVERLTGVELCIPALQERRNDLPAVIREVLRMLGGDRELHLSEDSMTRLLNHSWAGDVAELEQVLRTAVQAAGRRSQIESSNLPELRAEEISPEDEIRMEKLQDVVQQHVLDVLTRCGGNKLRAAEILGISRSTLYRMLEARTGESFAIR